MPDTTAPPQTSVMASTEVPATIVHEGGARVASSVYIVHPPEGEAALPETVTAPCGLRCGCRS